MSPSGIQVNKTFIIVIAGVFAGVFLLYKFWYQAPEIQDSVSVEKVDDRMAQSSASSWYKGDFVDVPQDILSAAKFQVTDSTVDVGDQKIFVRRAAAEKHTMDVLLLHGMKFSSQNWVDIGTLGFLAACGCRAAAIDLPGYGKSVDAKAVNNVQFMSQVVRALGLDRPVIISPSMSGGFSLPFLFERPESAVELSQGYIPVAPVGTEKYVDAYRLSKIPTMIVYGENDKSLGPVSLKNLKQLPNSKEFMIAKAGHPAYLDDKDYFHKLLYNFLKQLTS